jgi:RNA-directed DNA polymerase
MGGATDGAAVGPLGPSSAVVGETGAQAGADHPLAAAGLWVGAVAAGCLGGAGGDAVATRLEGQGARLTPAPARKTAPGKLFRALSRSCTGGYFALKTGSCTEDKIVQELTRRILESIYEPVFLDTSYGFRPGRSCHDALRRVNQEVMSAPVDWILDMDLARFFDTMPHREILAVLAKRIADRAFLRLIARMLKAGVQTPGGVVYDELGSPQGSIVSPVIANVFLDHVLDQWFATVVRQHCRGYCILLRYADDALALFEREDDAQRFVRVLPLRLGKFGLRLNAQKTRLLACGKRHAWQAFRARRPMPTFDFLGFTHYWGQSRTRKARLKRKTSKKRLRRALVELNRWLRQERNAQKLPDLWHAMGRKMRGHFNYFGVTDNSRALRRFERAVHRLLFKWLNRRSQRRSFSWERFCQYCKRHPLPQPGRLVQLNPVW